MDRKMENQQAKSYLVKLVHFILKYSQEIYL
jgi:hypothetical protein